MRKTLTSLALLAGLVAAAPANNPLPEERVESPRGVEAVATYSIVAYDPERKEWGVGVASKFLAVGAVVPWAKAGVGAIATQSFANTTYGPKGLELLSQGKSATEVVMLLTDGGTTTVESTEAVTMERLFPRLRRRPQLQFIRTSQEVTLAEEDKGKAVRQVGIIDANGNPASFTGAKCNSWAGGKTGKNYACQGNLLAGEAVVAGMAKAFEEAAGPLAWRIIAAMQAAEKAGGDKRGKQSAAILIVREKGGYGGFNDRAIDFRVDDHFDPVPELARILALRLRPPKK